MAFKADPAGQFRTDVHRRVAGHLTAPGESLGYTASALFHRVGPDLSVPVTEPDEIRAVLGDLAVDGLVVEVVDGVYQLTQDGFDLLTGGIADEPDEDAKPERPARLDGPTPLAVGGRGA